MLVPREVDDTGVWRLCASLEHTWLKRRLLPQLTREKAFWLAADQCAVPSALLGLPARLAETEVFLESALEGYSPAQLVRSGPLSNLPHDFRTAMMAAIHQQYLNAQIIQPLIASAEQHIADMRVAADALLLTWEGGTVVRRSELWDTLSKKAEALRSVLASFPTEIVLP
jgi:hypothetical protein